MLEPDNGTPGATGLDNEELISAIAQTILERLEVLNPPTEGDSEAIASTTYPRYPTLVFFRKASSLLSGFLLLYSLFNVFQRLFPEAGSPAIGSIASILSIMMGLTLIVLLVFEVFLGAGVDIERKLKKGAKILHDYQFIPSLNHLPFLLLLLGLGFLTIIFGFASLYAELLRHNSSNFFGLEEGFVSIYFSIVTFSTVGYGDIHPISIGARVSAICEIFISMFFSLIALSTTLSWVTAYERQQHELLIQKRIQELDNHS
ncbi:MAG: potassium channel family protein [Cyanobacteriota bacterium]|nr:potassium channel family protein [Cyanobacteriota bacterium]